MNSRLPSDYSGAMQSIFAEFYLLLAEIACDETSPHLFADEAA
jgi:hypothetical protein